jgi:predicted flap endonuclease-1-like 5' DNA nuclease
MRIRILRSVKDGSGWHEPGAIRDFEDKEAQRLIRLRAAESISLPSDDASENTEMENTEMETISYSQEEMMEIAEELKMIDGVDEDLAYRLIEAGYVTVQSVAEAKPEDLIKIKGVGKRRVVKIQESADDLILESGESSEEEEEEEE